MWVVRGVFNLTSFNLHADTYTCAGNFINMNQAHEGSVSVVSSELYGSNTGRMICSLNQSWKNRSTDVCRGWL